MGTERNNQRRRMKVKRRKHEGSALSSSSCVRSYRRSLGNGQVYLHHRVKVVAFAPTQRKRG